MQRKPNSQNIVVNYYQLSAIFKIEIHLTSWESIKHLEKYFKNLT